MHRPLLNACRRIAVSLVGVPLHWAVGTRLPHAAEIQVFQRYDDLPYEAQAVVKRAGDANVFCGPDWFRNFETTVADHEGQFCWYTIRDREKELFGVWPLLQIAERGRRTLRAMGNYYTPYATLPFAYDRENAATVFASAIRQLISGVDKLQITPVAPDDEFMRFIESKPFDMPVVTDVATINWYQRIGLLNDYYAQLDSTLRSTIARKQRALDREGQAVYRIVSDPEELETVMDAYLEVYAHSWKPSEPYPDFIPGFMRTFSRLGLLRLGLLMVGGRVAAAQIWIVCKRTAYIYKLAYVKEFGRKSVGTLLTWHMIQSTVRDDGVDCLDFLTGNDPYKEQWMKNSRALSSVTFVNLRRPFGIASYLRDRFWARH
jgi:CelD/BcsL family acetyltransferase involved in cellulose biosynthesis